MWLFKASAFTIVDTMATKTNIPITTTTMQSTLIKSLISHVIIIRENIFTGSPVRAACFFTREIK